jgi:hypothetical protein
MLRCAQHDTSETEPTTGWPIDNPEIDNPPKAWEKPKVATWAQGHPDLESRNSEAARWWVHEVVALG